MLKNWPKKNNHQQKKPIKIDKPLFFALIGILLFGLLAVYNSSIVSAFRDFHNPYHYVEDQGKFLVMGFILMIIVSFFDYHKLYKLSIPLLFLNLILLIAVFIPGIGIKVMGAKRWLNFGFTTLQPTELTKLTLCIYLSAWFAYKEKGRFVPFLILLSVVIGLVILQPDLGTAAIIIGIAIILYFISGMSWLHLGILVPIILGGVFLLSIIAPYRMNRLATFLNSNTDPLGTSYHMRQILISLGSGGMFGVGIGQSRQKYEYLPEANTDSIFAIIAEEIGFAGSVALIVLMMFIVYRSFMIAGQAPDRFGQLLACGIGSWYAIQTMINLGAMVGLIPLTGIPLPLISYGGSNMVSMLIGFGILFNINSAKKSFKTGNNS
jgi:cell division protein FtsW